MSTDIKIQKALEAIRQYESRKGELIVMRAAVHGNTQLDFKLTAKGYSMPITYCDSRSYLTKMKSVYDMVRLGLLKGLQHEIVDLEDLIKEKQIELSNLYNEKSIEMKDLSEKLLRR